MSYFQGYKGHETWNTCTDCRCKRPPHALQASGILKGETLYTCIETKVCKQLNLNLESGNH